MGMLETLKPIIKLVLFAMYGVYCVVGLVMFILGVYYYSQIVDASSSAFLVCLCAGLIMLAVGGSAIFATHKEDKLIMGACLCLNFVLFIVLLAATMVGMFLVYEVEDPVESAVTNVYSTSARYIEHRQHGWGIVVQSIPRGGPIACAHLRDSIDAACVATPPADAAYCAGTNDGSSPASCTPSHQEACEASTEVADDCVLTPMAHRGATPATCIPSADVPADDDVIACAAVTGIELDDQIECESVLTASEDDPAATKACAYSPPSAAVAGSCEVVAAPSMANATCTYVPEPTCNLLPDHSACAAASVDCDFTPLTIVPCALNADESACAVDGGNCVYHAAGESSYIAESYATIKNNYKGAKFTPEGNSQKQGLLAGNCSLVHDLLDGESGVQFRYQQECEKCWIDFEAYSVDTIKEQLWPATYVTFALFIFVIFLLLLNNYMVNNCEEQGEEEGEGSKWKPTGNVFIAGAVLNGIVLLFGLLTIILGAVANSDLNEGCEGTTLEDGGSCVNWACVGIIALGVLFFVVAGVSTGGMVLGGFIGRNMVRISNICFVVLSLALMVTGIAFAIVAGAITSINEEYDLKFESIRTQYETQDCNVCADPPDIDNDGCNDMRQGNSVCRAKIKEETKERIGIISMITGIVTLGFVAVLYITLQAVKIYSGDDAERESEFYGAEEEPGDDA